MIHRRRTAVMIRWGSISWVCGRVCEAHSLPKVQVLDQDSSGSETPMFMKLSAPLQQLYRHIGDRGKSAPWLTCSDFVKNETLPHSKKGRVNPINKLLACYRNSYVQPRALQHL